MSGFWRLQAVILNNLMLLEITENDLVVTIFYIVIKNIYVSS